MHLGGENDVWAHVILLLHETSQEGDGLDGLA